MAAAYSKELLVNSHLHRYRSLPIDTQARLKILADDLFEKVGRDAFRVYGCVTPEAVREYKNSLLNS